MRRRGVAREAITENPEKRSGPRIQTALPVLLKNAEGITRDVSASGVFFWTSESVCARGESISFWVELKSPERMMKLRCQGNVLRTEPQDGVMGVAVTITESAIELG